MKAETTSSNTVSYFGYVRYVDNPITFNIKIRTSPIIAFLVLLVILGIVIGVVIAKSIQ